MNDKVNTAVFDVDDTICSNNEKLSYDKCKPKKDVICKINYLHDELDFKIILYTSRGMVSCNGDVKKAIEKNKSIMEKWLEENDVHYDEIVFGKPIADLYVDDKAISLNEFMNEKFEKLTGGSGNNVIRIGSVVKKDLKDEKHLLMFKEWQKENDKLNACHTPKIYSYLYNEVYMEYINGELASNCLSSSLLISIVNKILSFENIKYNSFEINNHIEILSKNFSDNAYVNSAIRMSRKFLIKNAEELNKHASFCHGDAILSNMIINENNDIYFIDPQYTKESSSYLLDLAKLRNSLCNYEFIFGMSDKLNAEFKNLFDFILKTKGIYKLVLGLQIMYICRLYRYKSEEEKYKVVDMLKEVIFEYERYAK